MLLVNKPWNKSAYVPASTPWHAVSGPFGFLHWVPCTAEECVAPHSELWGWDPGVDMVCASQGTLGTPHPHISPRLFLHMTNLVSRDLPFSVMRTQKWNCSSCRPQTFSYINHRELLDSEHPEWKTHSWGDIDQTVYRYLHIEGH